MDPHGHIYALSDEEREALLKPVFGRRGVGRREERPLSTRRSRTVARLDGYLRGRADSDAPKRGKGANKDLAG